MSDDLEFMQAVLYIGIVRYNCADSMFSSALAGAGGGGNGGRAVGGISLEALDGNTWKTLARIRHPDSYGVFRTVKLVC